MANALTIAELRALRHYAICHGRLWKQELRRAWMAASEPGVLQALRNDGRFGPAGLARFRFPEDMLGNDPISVCPACGERKVASDWRCHCGGEVQK